MQALPQGVDHVLGGLHQLDQHAFTADREVIVGFRMHETNVVPAGSWADAAGGEAQTLLLQPLHRDGQVVHPKPHVVERRTAHVDLALGVQRLHQIDLHARRPLSEHADVLVHVLTLGAKLLLQLQAKEVHPKPAQAPLVLCPEGNLLQAKDSERSFHGSLRGGQGGKNGSLPHSCPIPNAPRPIALGSMAEVTEQHPPKFPDVSPQSWREAVERGLHGKRIEDKLTTTTSDGIVIQPLYEDQGEAREALPWCEGSWSPHESLPLENPKSWRARMQRAADFGVKGFRVGQLTEELEADLLGIARELQVELHLSSPVQADRAMGRLQQELRGGQTLLPGALTEELAIAASAGTTLFSACSSSEQGQGAGVALQVALCLTRGAAWLREAERCAVSATDAAGLVEFRVGSGTDLFLEIAKLRALRLCWTKLLKACAVQGPCKIHVEASARSWTVRDPWVNGLRGTTIAFAAAIGGAQSVLVLPFDAMLGASDEEALRLARNTHAILAQESHLDQVQDPAAGSGYIESLTNDIAQGAWVLFQELELLGADSTGFVAEEIERSAAADAAAIATRRNGLIGVSEFPNLEESLPERTGAPAFQNANTLAAPFEALRARSDRHQAQHGTRPTAFLCNFGQQVDFRPRSGFASNLLAAGGIAVQDNEGFQTVDAALQAYDLQTASLAVIASTDELYLEHVSSLARGLQERGAIVVLAGRAGEQEAEWTAAGVDTYIHLGCDALAALEHLQVSAGVSL